jgi:phage baseplate assembly protein W
MSDIIGSGLAFPLGVDRRGALGLVTGREDIEQALRLILGTAPGERPMRPEFGCTIHDLVFDTIDASTVGRIETAVRAAIERWEPRIDVTALQFDLAHVADGMLEITIGYRIRVTNAEYNLVYPFYVIPAGEQE